MTLGHTPQDDPLCVSYRTAIMLRSLGLNAIPLHGKLTQAKRLGALNKFKSKSRSILVATDVASRGLDIPHVDVVINFDIPTHSKVGIPLPLPHTHTHTHKHQLCVSQLTDVFLCRTTFIVWGGQHVPADLGDPSPLLHSKN